MTISETNRQDEKRLKKLKLASIEKKLEIKGKCQLSQPQKGTKTANISPKRKAYKRSNFVIRKNI